MHFIPKNSFLSSCQFADRWKSGVGTEITIAGLAALEEDKPSIFTQAF